MDDFIKRENAIETVRSYQVINNSRSIYDDGYNDAIDMASLGLNHIPAADVRPVIKAHWIETAPINEKTMKPLIVKGPHLKCSNCGSIEFQRNYCPNCGAEMKEIICNGEDK